MIMGPQNFLSPPFVDYLPMPVRPRLSWPEGRGLAFVLALNVEHYEFVPEPNPYKNAYPGVRRHPDVVGYGYRDYGNRIGFWRMLDVLDRYVPKVTVSLNARTLELYPEITAEMVARDWEFMSHGTLNTRYLYNLSRDEEAAMHREVIDTVRRVTGRRVAGLLGPSFTATADTNALIAEAGMTYSMDWLLDDQPFPINVPNGRLVGVPYSAELNDSFVFAGHPFPGYDGAYFEQICKAQFDVLHAESRHSGRVMTIAVHPFFLGLPHEIDRLERVLDYVTRHDDVWVATAGEIADHYLAHHYDAYLAAAAEFRTRWPSRGEPRPSAGPAGRR
jgi:peptidoglycan/xylan/chitin deacetylase (PgdA/CDA1 family)